MTKDKLLPALFCFSIGTLAGVLLEAQFFSNDLQPANAKHHRSSPAASTASRAPNTRPDDVTGLSGRPQLEVDTTTFDFGSAERGTTVEHTFALRNVGDAPLTITSVRPSCGCTVAELASNTIQPNEQSELKLSLSLADREGPQHKTVLIQSNDPRQPALQLAMVGTSVSHVTAEPERVDVDRARADEPVSKVVEGRGTEKVTVDGIGAGSE
jgi:hypothetical protein